ncbi:uncharacterized protein EDB93DRAFT_3642 [Suillus bovinus]|uniref:uncharacterized protein n=1 Tax=Suillus bovinus TaxID=48563 RepID=UPI001B88412C|nr:uncharacterized protein EDB93DRAFT_3642 [Suillus bovinus]KAG2159629.1 hypothetical protein EDB93DRAFT_3642 [Suillus bovinus]
MPVETRSATHAHNMSFNGTPSRPRRQRRTNKSENEDTTAQKTEVKMEPVVGEKREVLKLETVEETEGKRPKTEEADTHEYTFAPGVIERGHIYFFYRPKVQREEVHSVDDVSKLHLLLVPSPSEPFSMQGESADAVPAPESTTKDKKHFRLIIVGKKRLPDPEHEKHVPIWATVVFLGDNLHDLEKKLGEKTYETKTRGRGVYAIVNSQGNVPSRNATHLGYHLSHPTELGDVQKALGIHVASSFVIQVKNPNAEAEAGQRIGLPKSRRARYSEDIMKYVFGRGEKGRSSIGLRFTNCNRVELLEHEGAELLFIPAHTGTKGNDQSLGNGRREALEEVSRRESEERVEQIFKELAFHKDRFPAEPLKGEWA